MTQISDIENVVRIIFPSTMMRDGELLPSAGESASFISMAIRRRLVDIAKRKITSVMYLF